jgi:hypothetical protein
MITPLKMGLIQKQSYNTKNSIKTSKQCSLQQVAKKRNVNFNITAIIVNIYVISVTFH